ncbi:MAG: hypothetical protein ACYC5O_10090 [Anaerolineae bacterium]
MKRTLVVTAVAVAVALLLALGTVAVAAAQGPNGGANGTPCPMIGGSRFGIGVMHDDMVAAVATRLGLSVDDIEARLAGGETMWQIARSQGLSDEEITTLMRDAMQEALDAAVANGDLTQEQADRMGQMGRFMGLGAGLGRAGRGMGMGLGCRGARSGQSA